MEIYKNVIRSVAPVSHTDTDTNGTNKHIVVCFPVRARSLASHTHLLDVVLVARRYRIGADARIGTGQIDGQTGRCDASFCVDGRHVVIVIMIRAVIGLIDGVVNARIATDDAANDASTAATDDAATDIVVVVVSTRGGGESTLVGGGTLWATACRTGRLSFAAVAVNAARRRIGLSIAGKVLAIVGLGAHKGRIVAGTFFFGKDAYYYYFEIPMLNSIMQCLRLATYVNRAVYMPY